MKLEKLNLDDAKLTKSQLAAVKGGTSTTEYKEVGYAETEYELDPDTGKRTGKKITVEFPDNQ